jgi:hypothetical protein
LPVSTSDLRKPPLVSHARSQSQYDQPHRSRQERQHGQRGQHDEPR